MEKLLIAYRDDDLYGQDGYWGEAADEEKLKSAYIQAIQDCGFTDEDNNNHDWAHVHVVDPSTLPDKYAPEYTSLISAWQLARSNNWVSATANHAIYTAEHSDVTTKNGVSVALTQEAFLDGNGDDTYYSAHGIDAAGNEYRIRWALLYPEHRTGEDGNCIVPDCDGGCEDEGNACDWDDPSEIKLI